MSKQVILTGIRANNDLHIGNYFGALLPIVDMAKKHAGEYQINLFVPDLHSFTTPIDHSKLYEQTMHNLKLFAAAGLPLDHDDIHIYRQSFIPAHSELTWILDCFTGFGDLTKMIQFKDKSERIDFRDEIRNALEHYSAMKQKFGDKYGEQELVQFLETSFSALQALVDRQEKETAVGLFNYPVLMACDILLYGAIYVPVGDDQSQHIEFTRDIGERMNAKFGRELFTLPKPVKEQHTFFGKDQGLRIKDLADPTKKMSKSATSDKGVIFLGDDPAIAAKKIMSATTDSVGAVHLDYNKQPGISNLLQILALLQGQTLQEVSSEYEGKTSYGELKSNVAEAVKNFLTDFQNSFAKVDAKALQSKLEQDEAKMNEIAGATLLKVQKAVGLRA